MSKQSIIPFGPQHPVLPEPIHIDLVLEDEKVIKAIPSIGFVQGSARQTPSQLTETRKLGASTVTNACNAVRALKLA